VDKRKRQSVRHEIEHPRKVLFRVVRTLPALITASVIGVFISVFFYHASAGHATAWTLVPILSAFIATRLILAAFPKHRRPVLLRTYFACKVYRLAKIGVLIFIFSGIGSITFFLSAWMYHGLGMKNAQSDAFIVAMVVGGVSVLGLSAAIVTALCIKEGEKATNRKSIEPVEVRSLFVSAVLLASLIPEVLAHPIKFWKREVHPPVMTA